MTAYTELPNRFLSWPALVVRRFLLPALLATAAINALLMLFLLSDSADYPSPGDFFGAVAVLTVFTAPAVTGGLGLYGIPLGLLVARQRYGLRRSFAALVGLGALGGILVGPVGLGALGGGSLVGLVERVPLGASLLMAACLSVCGAVTAVIWTLLNRDLFRLENGA